MLLWLLAVTTIHIVTSYSNLSLHLMITNTKHIIISVTKGAIVLVITNTNRNTHDSNNNNNSSNSNNNDVMYAQVPLPDSLRGSYTLLYSTKLSYPTLYYTLLHYNMIYYDILDSLRGSSVDIGTTQRGLARPLCKDDTGTSRSVNSFAILYYSMP